MYAMLESQLLDSHWSDQPEDFCVDKRATGDYLAVRFDLNVTTSHDCSQTKPASRSWHSFEEMKNTEKHIKMDCSSMYQQYHLMVPTISPQIAQRTTGLQSPVSLSLVFAIENILNNGQRSQ